MFTKAFNGDFWPPCLPLDMFIAIAVLVQNM